MERARNPPMPWPVIVAGLPGRELRPVKFTVQQADT